MRRSIPLLAGLVVLIAAGAAWQLTRDGSKVSEECDTKRVYDGQRKIDTRTDIDTVAFGTPISIDRALAMDTGPDGTMYVATKSGQVWAVTGGAEPRIVLDLSAEVATGYEQGLLGLAVSPDGRFMYLNFTEVGANTTHVVEFELVEGLPDETTRREVLTLDQPEIFHNGGNLEFTSDGLLWISTGDGGASAASNTPDNLYGSILRIDPRPNGGAAYGIPAGNPYLGDATGRDEVWVYGLRNPWQFSVDEPTGDLWIGDVGQDCWDEIDYLPATDGAGAAHDLGWNRFEGDYEYLDSGASPEGVTFAAYVGAHDDGFCSIAAGRVYRGTALPDLQGWLLFADWCQGAVTAIRPTGPNAYEVRSLGLRLQGIVSFAADGDGELYVVSITDGIFPLVPAS